MDDPLKKALATIVAAEPGAFLLGADALGLLGEREVHDDALWVDSLRRVRGTSSSFGDEACQAMFLTVEVLWRRLPEGARHTLTKRRDDIVRMLKDHYYEEGVAEREAERWVRLSR